MYFGDGKMTINIMNGVDCLEDSGRTSCPYDRLLATVFSRVSFTLVFKVTHVTELNLNISNYKLFEYVDTGIVIVVIIRCRTTWRIEQTMKVEAMTKLTYTVMLNWRLATDAIIYM